MKKLKVSDLKPGMVFDQPVYIDPNNVLVQARQEIAERDIDRLTKWGILEVETNGEVITAEQESSPASGGAAAAGGKETAAAQKPASTPATGSAPAKPAQSSPAPPAGAQESAPAAAPAGKPDELTKAMLAQYEDMRKNKRNFKTILTESAEALEQNMFNLLENRIFENQAVIKIAQRLVEQVASKNLLLILFHGIRFTSNTPIFHAIHAACYGVVIGQVMNYSRPRLHELAFAMLLMDTGMFKIPGHVRDKAAALTEQERASVKTHPLLGYQLLLKNGKVKASLATVALQHHEAFDGSGYPQGLKGGQIEELARVASICDTYTAMIEKRPWRKAILPYDAMKSMLSNQMQRFDPRLLRLFLGRISIYPIGSLVQLSDNRIGMVVACRPDKPLRPVLRLMRDENGEPYGDVHLLDLVQMAELYIIKALSPASAGIDIESEV